MKEIGKSRLLKSLALRAICTALLICACSGLSLAAGQPFNTTVPGDIMSQFRSQRTLWTTNVWVYANNLFGILALIEFTWSAAVMLLEKSDLQTWTAALVRKIMWIGAFYALLINGRFWIPAIIDSFTQMGAGAAGLGSPLNPGDVFGQGLMIAGGLMDSGASSAFFTKPGTSSRAHFRGHHHHALVHHHHAELHRDLRRELPGYLGRVHFPRLRRKPLDSSLHGKIHWIGRCDWRKDSASLLPNLGRISVGRWLDERGHGRGQRSLPGHECVRRDGRSGYFHDVLLADSEAVLGGSRGSSGFNGRRSGIDRYGHRCGNRGGRFTGGSGRGVGCGGGRSRRRRSGDGRWFCRFSRWIIQRREWRFFRAIWGRRIGAASISPFAIRGAKKRRFRRLRRPRPSTGPAILCQFGER